MTKETIKRAIESTSIYFENLDEIAAAILAEQKAEQAPAVTPSERAWLDADKRGEIFTKELHPDCDSLEFIQYDKDGKEVMIVNGLMPEKKASQSPAGTPLPTDAPKEGEVMELTKKIHKACSDWSEWLAIGFKNWCDENEDELRLENMPTNNPAITTEYLYNCWLRSKEQKGEQHEI